MYPEQRGPGQESQTQYGAPPMRPPTPAAGNGRHTEAVTSSATRHLCAGAYVDDTFRDACLREVLHQPRRVVAPSYGFDLLTVLGHCQRARNIAIYRDATILGIAVATACLSATSLLVAVIMLVYLNAAVATYRLLREAFRQLRAGNLAIRSLVASLWGNALNVVASIIVLFIAYLILAALSANALAGAAFGQPGALLAATFGGLVLFFVFLALPVGANIWRQIALDALAPGHQPAPPRMSPRMQEINSQQGGNAVIYSDYRPFVGSGEVVNTWGFAQRLVRAGDPLGLAQRESEREFEVPPFTGLEIVAHVRDQLDSLRYGDSPERILPGLTVEDRIFLAGTETSNLSPWMRPEMIPQIIRNPIAPARHYLACQVVSWRGELVATVYVHLAVQGKSLYMEMTATALVPCKPAYRAVDTVDCHGAMAYLRAIRQGVLDGPRTVGAAAGSLFRAGVDALALSTRATVAQAVLPRGFDYGARIGVRELGMAADTRDHLQTQEILKHIRVIERRVLAAVLDFLEDRDVDITEYRQRSAGILNFGAINTGAGGTANAGPSAPFGVQNLVMPAPGGAV
jgi:hypothetical protein